MLVMMLGLRDLTLNRFTRLLRRLCAGVYVGVLGVAVRLCDVGTTSPLQTLDQGLSTRRIDRMGRGALVFSVGGGHSWPCGHPCILMKNHGGPHWREQHIDSAAAQGCRLPLPAPGFPQVAIPFGSGPRALPHRPCGKRSPRIFQSWPCGRHCSFLESTNVSIGEHITTSSW